MTTPYDADFSADAVRLRAGDGTEALIVPSAGAVCARCRTPHEDGWAHLLAPIATREAVRERPTSVGGFPILYPHPGRHRVPLLWRGRAITPSGVGEALPGHGFAAGAAWTVVQQTASTVTCRLDSRDVPGADERWPWPAVLTADYRVSPGALEFELEIESRADEPAPLMPGLHPYFPLRFVESDPATPEEARHSCAVWVEADELWALERGAATGDAGPVSGPLDLNRPRSVAAIEDHFGGRMPVQLYGRRDALEGAASRADGTAAAATDAPGGVTSGVWDRAAGLAVTFEISRAFGTVALYRPPDPLRLSLEPRAALPDALYVAATRPGVPTGLRSLDPGARARFRARLTLSRRPAVEHASPDEPHA
jgi:galactose mutarotase-like enzyme